MVRIVALVLLVAAALWGVACGSGTPAPEPGDDDDDVAGCNANTTLSCPAGFTGFTCDAGDNPESEDSTLACTAPMSDSSNADDYCCFTGLPGSSTTCQPDDDVTLACVDGSVGFSCAIGDDPTTFDSTLTCSDSSDTSAGESDFCCFYGGAGTADGGPAPTGCVVDPTLDCAGSGTVGYACAIGDNPEAEDTSLACSDPITDADHEDDYCCFSGYTGSSTTCTPDDDVTLACDRGYGFSCVTGDDPTSYDASLTCSDSTDTASGASLFCCTYG